MKIIRCFADLPHGIHSAFNAGGSDTRGAPGGKIIRALNDAGYANAAAYDDVLEDAAAAAWPMFRDVKQRTAKPIVDCRYML